MRLKSLGFFSLLVAFLFSSLISCSGGGGDSSGSGSGGGGSPPNPPVQSSLSVQIQDISNWEVYQGKDNTSTNVLASKSFSQQILVALNDIFSAISGKVAVALIWAVSRHTAQMDLLARFFDSCIWMTPF
jgi:hypothetical protein